MRLDWRRGSGCDVDLWANGKFVAWVDGDNHPYGVHITHALAGDMMPCEEVRYVTLRDAMRAAKAIVTVLLIGESYAT